VARRSRPCARRAAPGLDTGTETRHRVGAFCGPEQMSPRCQTISLGRMTSFRGRISSALCPSMVANGLMASRPMMALCGSIPCR
jgi:hypothetical protein